VLKDCSINDVEIIACCLKVILNTFLKLKTKLQQKFIVFLQKKLKDLSSDCQIIIVKKLNFFLNIKDEYGDSEEDIHEII